MENGNKIEMELSDMMIEKMNETFDLEIQLLNGTKTKLDNGQWRIIIHVSDEKLMMFKDLVNMLMSLPTNQIKVKYMGIEIKQN